MKKNEIIAARLKKVREQKGISQQKLAELCGWVQSRIGNYETGSRSIGIDDAITMAGALAISPVELIFGEDTVEMWLSLRQRKLIALYNQLPESEQDRMYDLFQMRLKELDDYVEKYLRGRLKESDE